MLQHARQITSVSQSGGAAFVSYARIDHLLGQKVGDGYTCDPIVRVIVEGLHRCLPSAYGR